MSVYVDDMKAPYGRMFMCHMIADTPAELRAMAEKIGVAKNWIQAEGTRQEHFDICQQKRCQAVMFGAIEVTQRELVNRLARNEVARDAL